MKQSLQLKIGTQLSMTPQLQQAIRLLQLSTLDLQQEIQQALDSNPMLEVEENGGEISVNADGNTGDNEPTANANESDRPTNNKENDADFHEDSGQSLNAEDNWQENIPDNLSGDFAWEDVYQPQQANASSTGSNSSGDNGDFDYINRNSAEETLQDQLYWQLNLTNLVDTDRLIAAAIIDDVEPSGFLSSPPEDIFDALSQHIDIEFEEFEAVRQLIQQFEPVGVASRDLRECLLVQLQQLPPKTPFLNDARLIVDRHIKLLGNHDYAQLKRRTKFKEIRLKEAITLIQSLTPTPGDIIDNANTEYIAPDIFVKKQEGHWVIELNQDCTPSLKINDSYASLVKRADNSDDNTYLRNNLQEARWFIKSLQSRNDTMLKVAGKIVEHQRGFLDYGEEAMKPLVLQDIAKDIDMHESTISRVTTKKYMHTPRGIYELKYFFSSHVSTDSGGECSSTAIRAIIKKLIAQENPKKPLSDNKLTTLLDEQGIKVARRTVAKYRESMAIPPSNERKRLV